LLSCSWPEKTVSAKEGRGYNRNGSDGLLAAGAGRFMATRWLVSPLMMLLIAWGGVTVVLIVLLIYRSTLTMHEDDQLFLDDSSMHMQEEQVALQKRMGKIRPFVRVLGVASGLLIVVIAGVWIWQGLQNF
jgi:hypothetical protein